MTKIPFYYNHTIHPKYDIDKNGFYITFVRIKRGRYYLIPVKNKDYLTFIGECYKVLLFYKINRSKKHLEYFNILDENQESEVQRLNLNNKN